MPSNIHLYMEKIAFVLYLYIYLQLTQYSYQCATRSTYLLNQLNSIHSLYLSIDNYIQDSLPLS